MRVLSADGLKALLSQETGEIFLSLLTIDDDSFDNPLFFVNDNTDLDYNGDTYLGYPFKVELPGEEEETSPMTKLSIDVVDQQITNIIRNLSKSPDVTLEIVRKSIDPDTLDYIVASEITIGGFKIKSVTYDRLTMTAQLGYEDNYLTQKATKDVFDRQTAPGLIS